MLRSLLVAVDLSPLSDRVVGRAALLPLAPDARLALLHVVSSRLPPRARRAAERDARRALDAEVADLRHTLPATTAIQSLVKVGAPAAELGECAKSMRAELIVMGRGGGRVLRDVFLGSTAERVVRQATRPVLVVRLRPRTRYRRPALALDLDPVAHEVLAWVPRLIPRPRPRVAIIHAAEDWYRGMMYPSLSADAVEELLEHEQAKAVRELSKLVATALASDTLVVEDTPLWTMHVQHGAATRIIEKAVEKASVDLLMLGTRAYRGIARAFLGSVAGDVLRSVGCDVLVVPPTSSG